MTRLLLLSTLFLALNFCTQKKNEAPQNYAKSDSSIIVQQKSELDLNDSLPNQRFKKSEIINPKFDSKLIFGVWALSYDDPACDFEINDKMYIICDYDGDGQRLYKIVGDSIFLDNPYLIFKGKILNATGDTIVIHWQENENPETLLRWKE